MKKDQLQNLKEKSLADLTKELQSVKDQLWQFQVDLSGGKSNNVRKIRESKKVIAVINTLLRQK